MLPLRADVPTVAEQMQRQGFKTAAVVNVLWLHPQSGANRGFDHYDFEATDASNRKMRTAQRTTQAAIDWLETLPSEAPFFLVVHYFDPHLTYDPPAPYDTMFLPEGAEASIPVGFGSAEEVFRIRSGELQLTPQRREALIARYDGELRYMDEEIGRLRRALEQRGRWDNSLVAFTADHGEEFWDHGGFEHGHSHFREMIQVPLIVRGPAGSIWSGGKSHTGRVRNLDLVATLLDQAGAPLDQLPGRSLDGFSADYAVAEGTLWAGDIVSVRADSGMAMLQRDRGEARFFGPDDGEESKPRRASSTEAKQLVDLLRALPPLPQAADDAWEPSPEQLERLRSLGYVR